MSDSLSYLATLTRNLPLYFGEKKLHYQYRHGQYFHNVKSLLIPACNNDFLEFYYPFLPKTQRQFVVNFSKDSLAINQTLINIHKAIWQYLKAIGKEMGYKDYSYSLTFFVHHSEQGESYCDCIVVDEYNKMVTVKEIDDDTLYSFLTEEDDDIPYSDNELIKDIQDRIDELTRKTGGFEAVQKLFYDIIRDRKDVSPELKKAVLTCLQPPKEIPISRLCFDNNGDIILSDYNDLRIFMAPMPKSFFFFYLIHPEGVHFMDLQNYEQELLSIYIHFARYHSDKMKDNIHNLVDPFNDFTRNTNVNRIKRAFATKLAPEYIIPYCIQGERGEKKSISIDRKLVDYGDGECKELREKIHPNFHS